MRHDRDDPRFDPHRRPPRPGKPSPPRRRGDKPPFPPKRKPPRPPPRGPAAGGTTSWEHVASWYDRLVGEEGSDYHRNVILPAAERMLDPQADEKVLDLCCGQGVFCRMLAARGVRHVVGADASESLIASARQRGPAHVRYAVADARDAAAIPDRPFDAAACLMAVHDVDDLPALFATLAAALRTGGRAVVIFLHPCFRIPRQSSWEWDDQKRTQYRRLDRYASDMAIPIATHPGRGGDEHTVFFHRPLAACLNALGAAGLAVVAAEELLSHHVSQPGGHSRGENRARQEFPVFLALKAVKL
ncbi:MAG: Malonyl-(acyl-carrier protein) O-methyltransferase [Planctomycetes bacterium ADurb.Bin126]|nr:MAG: Malonyl-(acyl-carrier protein) O-methyltransferase [Planctomycetes bacterium ADurb.Bin126]HOD82217.1 class I SAM-dependent methyltransferase [Phycisphaerae bacterium]HQL74653.1 class I SAM-dependent methyltransferase [Phycisphaerae bacterium]